jgi:hypothetical protein
MSSYCPAKFIPPLLGSIIITISSSAIAAVVITQTTLLIAQ